MPDRLEWTRDGRDWPNRDASRFVEAGGITWHVQVMGKGPVILLLHGTGSSTHSWAPLAPLLWENFTLVAPDLPGHAFTGSPHRSRLTLPGMAALVSDLVRVLGVTPDLVAGHSAGAAILLRMCLDRTLRPKAVVSINGALLPMGGWAGPLFSPLAKALVLNPLVPHFFTWRAGSSEAVKRVLEGTGSEVNETELRYYARLFQSVSHVQSTLAMMAGWDLAPFLRDLARLDVPLVLLAGAADKAVPPSDADRVRATVPAARVVKLAGLGHLAHEERPGPVAEVILGVARDEGLITRQQSGDEREEGLRFHR